MSTQTLETKTFTPVKNTILAVRRTRRAYLGLHVAAFEQAQIGFAKARKLTDGLFEELVAKGELIEAKAEVAVKGTQAKFIESYTETTETVRDLLPTSGNRVEELEAEVEALNAKLKTLKTPAKKAASKKTAVKKIAVKKTAAKKAPSKKAVAAKSETKTDALDDKYVSYVEDVRGYDKEADAAIVKKIVDHCGIALQSRDGLFVACSDETERHTVRDSWLVKKLGLKGETAELDAKVMTVCETMQKDRMKSRVTFYYLLAKNEGKLASL
jgi:vacuolar-type H+-ATPase subunit I/STV1